MPNYFMPAKNPEEVKTFFDDMVQQGKLKIVLAPERPDIYSRLAPTDEIHLVVDAAEKSPPEGADFDRVLSEFRPTPLPEDQVASWAVKEPEPPTDADQASSSEEGTIEVPSAATDQQVEEDMEDAPAMSQVDNSPGILDKPWKPFTERGFKG